MLCKRTFWWGFLRGQQPPYHLLGSRAGALAGCGAEPREEIFAYFSTVSHQIQPKFQPQLSTQILPSTHHFSSDVDGPLLGRIGLRRLDLVVLALGGLGELVEGHRSVSLVRDEDSCGSPLGFWGCSVLECTPRWSRFGLPWSRLRGVVVSWSNGNAFNSHKSAAAMAA